MSEHCTFLRAGNLTAVVGDDTPRGPGGQQYSGLWTLLHKDCSISPFQTAYAGLIASAHRGTGPTLEPIDESDVMDQLASHHMLLMTGHHLADLRMIAKVFGWKIQEP